MNLSLNTARLESLLDPQPKFQEPENILKINIPQLNSHTYTPLKEEIYSSTENGKHLNYDSAIKLGSENSQFRYGFQEINGKLMARVFLKEGTGGGFISTEKLTQYKEIFNRVENSSSEFEILEADRYAREVLKDKSLSYVLMEKYLAMTKDNKIDHRTKRYKIDTLTRRYLIAREHNPDDNITRGLASELYYSYGDSHEDLLLRKILNDRHNINKTNLKQENRADRKTYRDYKTRSMTLAEKRKYYFSKPKRLFELVKDKFEDLVESKDFSFNY